MTYLDAIAGDLLSVCSMVVARLVERGGGGGHILLPSQTVMTGNGPY